MQKTKRFKNKNLILRGVCQVVVMIHQYKLSVVFNILQKTQKMSADKLKTIN